MGTASQLDAKTSSAKHASNRKPREAAVKLFIDVACFTHGGIIDEQDFTVNRYISDLSPGGVVACHE